MLQRSITLARSDPEHRLCALLRAAELECALADLAHPAATYFASLSDALAALWTSGERPLPLEAKPHHELPAQLELKRPEGYAYYALDPAAYARSARECSLRGDRALVIGVRSIGTSLSAAFAAGLAARSVKAVRCTVRPGGHPWQREMHFSAEQVGHLRQHSSADVFIVDEGPGLSGSTFLSVAEAACSLGIPAEQITLCSSHRPDPTRLVARDARARWARYRHLVAESPRELPSGARELSAGSWRQVLYPSEDQWPACWQQQERLKFLSEGELWKFEGFAPYDEGAYERSLLLTQGGFAPRPRRSRPGYLSFAWCNGRPARPGDAGCALERMAEYLAFRTRELPSAMASAAALEEMMRVNVAEALGVDLPPSLRLELERPIVPDARMMPHEWLLSEDGTLLKVDGADHGDDHLLPGSVDVAWDLAGAVIEWQLTASQTNELLASFQRLSGHDASRRLHAYCVAYTAFRVGALSMAELSSVGSESARLSHAKQRYSTRLSQLLKEKPP